MFDLLLLLLLQDWDTTTVEWFSNDKETDVALPEYRLTFLWLEKTLACGVDQVGQPGRTTGTWARHERTRTCFAMKTLRTLR
jgi:hypothetical protein